MSRFQDKVLASYTTAKAKTSTSKKELALRVVENRVISRSMEAEITVRVEIDEEKLKTKVDAFYASELKDFEKGIGDEKPDRAKIEKDWRADALDELKSASNLDVSVSKDGTLRMSRYDNLKATVLFEGKEVGAELDGVEFTYKGAEVHDVDDPEYRLVY